MRPIEIRSADEIARCDAVPERVLRVWMRTKTSAAVVRVRPMRGSDVRRALEPAPLGG